MKIQEVNYPTLYKKNTQGKIEQWTVQVVTVSNKFDHYGVKVTFGEKGGKLQEKVFYIGSGKNIGKKNETSVQEQAWLEAEAKHNKKLKQGYVKDIKAARAGETDSIIKGGIIPMLAHSYDDYYEKVEFPCYVQPKLDGQRCIAIRDNKKKVTLWTRTRKPITSCPHVVKELEQILLHVEGEVALDGELYHHELKDKFEELMSAVRKEKPSEASQSIQFHVYDCAVHPEGAVDFSLRNAFLETLPDWCESVKFVPTALCYKADVLEKIHDAYVKEGYEGMMVRSCTGLYENKRSKHLLKFKKFQDAEFPIQGVLPGKDNTVVFKCKTKAGTTFEATMSGDKKNNQKYLKDSSLWKGKKLTVKFQGLTGKNGVPRFPVGLRIREGKE
jgi:ATP-dependent DNA ligase